MRRQREEGRLGDRGQEGGALLPRAGLDQALHEVVAVVVEHDYGQGRVLQEEAYEFGD